MPDPVAGISTAAPPSRVDPALRAAAMELEAAFLSEMLKAAKLGEVPEGFGGGAGEAQFASLLRDEQARAMAAAGGIGLAETLFNALKERQIHGY
ncbi:rod-binding protein [Maritimibacter alkaliphilus]|uniref:rod-binding protein n=1 Tax=Maritimibacter alkaliphilus TaxID=404236 RepID=UPI001C97749B|nr:rod-binding protein [Maritimibacter alkaliphilus]MBY6090651.1 rod-binding protein [Maritimibacter alkaliphilus]